MAYQTAIQTTKSILFTTAALLIALTSCHRASNPHIDYLNTAVGSAAEDGVVSTWGPPAHRDHLPIAPEKFGFIDSVHFMLSPV
jgi:hypothetical protein